MRLSRIHAIYGKTSKQGRFMVLRRTAAKRIRAKLQQIKVLLLGRKHDPVQQTGKWLRSFVQGYFNYHAVPGNGRSMGKFREQVARYWRLALRRRSQKSRMTWYRFRPIAKRWIRFSAFCVPFPVSGSTPFIQGKSLMREIRPWGSVRGVPGNWHSYRDLC